MSGTGARAHLALVLDVPDLDDAAALARELAPWFGIAKVGVELWAAAGPAAVGRMQDLGFEVFADLKLHDIPTTVGRAARVIGRLGVAYLNFHAAGGVEMLRAGVDGLEAGAAEAGRPRPVALAVTVLTSEPDTAAFDERLAAARAAGCGGVVCSVHELATVRRCAPGLRTVVPGVRPAGAEHHDQARVGTPEEVVRAGGDVLVVGRAVTAAPDRRAAARAIHDAVATALEVG